MTDQSSFASGFPPNMPASGQAVFDRAGAAASDYNALVAVMRRMLVEVRTAIPVKVCAVSGAGLAPVGFVDVQPMVHQQDAAGQTMPHGVVYNVPYFRLQGGGSAVVLDPAVGDIGLAVMADRDILNVKTARTAAPPGSFRHNSMADALYLGGFLNAAPSQYIQFTPDGVVIHTPGTVEISAKSLKISGDASISGSLNVGQDVQAGGVSLVSHVHGGVMPGSGTTSAPQG